MCLDIRVLDKYGAEIELRDEDEDDDFTPDFKDDFYQADESEIEASGFTIENVEEDLELVDENLDISDEEVRI